MNRIALLPEQVANQIAAGEVIERPASVLKELLENSLDAQATQIDVQVRAGGRSLVSVTDNGQGMSRDDALLCLERHATSKLRVSADLDQLLSYGFRGEAIPSIASVSKFRLRSREADALSGTEIEIEGGKLLAVREVGLASGTQIEVRSLFYNLPARRKFLRTEATETAHLKHTLLLAGLARPDVGFTFGSDEQTAQRWCAGEDLTERLISIYGLEWLELTLPIVSERDGLRLSGFIGKPGISRAAKSEELFFVNQRPVDNRTLHYGLMEGYHNTLMKGRYPVAILFLEMEPSGLDVNIHPAKREVRFHDDFRLRTFVVQAVQETLRGFSGIPAARVFFAEERIPREAISSPLAPAEESIDQADALVPEKKPPLAAPDYVLVAPEPPPPLVEQSALPLPEPLPQNQPRREALFLRYAPNRLGLRVLGDIAHLYLIAEGPEGLVLIDQHAAHERILFEQMLARIARQDPGSQQLLFPVTIDFPPREADFLHRQVESLQQTGVGIHPFGAGSFLIDALPTLVKPRDVATFLRNIVTDLQEAGGEIRKTRRLSEEVVAKTVCRHAVKANDALKPAEWDQLLVDLLACELPYTCPHGRPTMIQLSLTELGKKFGRAA